MAALESATERPALPDEVLLADELLERPRAHPRGERLPLGRGLEERLGSCSGESARRHAGQSTRGRSSDREDAGDVDEVMEHEQRSEHDRGDDADPADVASDIGVLMGGAH